MTFDEMRAALNFHTIRRWPTIEVTRQQSVPEHSYRVWLLTRNLYELMFPVEHNSIEREDIGRWALLHDIEEVVVGDLASTTKDKLESLSPGVCDKMVTAILEVHFPTVAGYSRGQKRSIGSHIVKICDHVEAVHYLKRYGLDYGQYSQVVDYQLTLLWTAIENMAKTYNRPAWEKEIKDWASRICDIAPGLTYETENNLGQDKP